MPQPLGAYAWSANNIQITSGERDYTNDHSSATYPWLFVDPDRPGLTIWVINNGTTSMWPHEEYGQFYQAKVFLVLNIVPHSKAAVKHIHVWVGKYASLIDYKAAVTSAIDLYMRLESHPTLHREVQGLESRDFHGYFNPIVYWSGSPDTTSYRHCRLRKRSYKARMLQLYKTDPHSSNMVAKQVPCNVKELDPAYTYILDVGHLMYIWQGDLTSTEDDLQSIQFVEQLRSQRGGCVKIQMLNEEVVEGHEFFCYLSQDGYRREDEYEDEDENSVLHKSSVLYGGSIKKTGQRHQFIQVYYDTKSAHRKKRKSDLSALDNFQFRKVRDGRPTKKDFLEGGIFIYDTGEHCWIWFSKKTLEVERELAFVYAHTYLKNTRHPLLPVTMVKEEHINPEFRELLKGSSAQYIVKSVEHLLP